jgi:hypothetical protein
VNHFGVARGSRRDIVTRQRAAGIAIRSITTSFNRVFERNTGMSTTVVSWIL